MASKDDNREKLAKEGLPLIRFKDQCTPEREMACSSGDREEDKTVEPRVTERKIRPLGAEGKEEEKDTVMIRRCIGWYDHLILKLKAGDAEQKEKAGYAADLLNRARQRLGPDQFYTWQNLQMLQETLESLMPEVTGGALAYDMPLPESDDEANYDDDCPGDELGVTDDPPFDDDDWIDEFKSFQLQE
ncbi:hypothetical protein QKN85_gp2 [San Jacinto virus]|uniref:Protein X n=1 Tax=San Jacinto virus TaxID=2596788 RepID=A0A516EL17_9MONO|nr:hypothetical protein QKN85_gp2 [San Jacinto virus]QDO67012.1 hypothetical protein [San Jacinto virus]QFQ60715.1 protein X [San Jacinto virus]